MSIKISPEISAKNVRVSMFLFLSLLFFSTGFFVFADDTSNGKNIFQDSDQDGISNDEEKLYGTDAQKKDTDGDGYSDGVEVESGYDPLKPAPGDRLVKANPESGTSGGRETNGEANLTEQVSQEIVSVLNDSATDEGEVTMEDLNASVEKILSGESEEIALPEINLDEIKTKKSPSKSLKEDERKEKIRKDAMEYLTVMSYIFANNTPKSFSNENELSSILNATSTESIVALASGNAQYINGLSERGEKMLHEIRDVEVPEDMLDVHVKALKLAQYATELKSEVNPDGTDPLGQIATFSKIQGLLGVAATFSEETHQKLVELNIDIIPLDL